MQVMRKLRQLHLWIGLICAIFILIEAVTGLLMLEPSLIGGGGGPDRGAFPVQMQQKQTADGSVPNNANPGARPFRGDGGFRPGQGGGAGVGGISSFIRNLHQGRIGGTDVHWVMDLAAVGMIILTTTGIVLSTKTLAGQRAARRRKRSAELQS
jgi:hypothetical protein